MFRRLIDVLTGVSIGLNKLADALTTIDEIEITEETETTVEDAD